LITENAMLKNILLTLIILSFSTIIIRAQDSTNTEKNKWKWHWENLSDMFEGSLQRPTVTLDFGLSDIKRKDAVGKFAKNNLFELKVGYTSMKLTEYSPYITRYKYRNFYLSNNSTNLAGGKNKSDEISTNNWRFGYNETSGYGYKLGKESTITTYFTYSIDWTRMDFKDTAYYKADQRIFDLYDKSFRFGNSSEAGIKIQPVDFLMFDLGYERSQVFQRHLFWKWAGSSIIELASHGILDAFINEILKSSPKAGPVAFVLLKGALAYGIYELRSDKMNWPFKSAKPITYNNIKFGMTFMF
jgi:hypothetical protein